MRGRPRKPTQILELLGAFNKNPKRKKEREGEPIENKPLQAEPPAYLPKRVQEIWREELTRLVPGVVLQSDHSAFETLCRLTYAERRNRLDTAGIALLTRMREGFGMTPSSRSRVKVWSKPSVPEPNGDKNPAAAFFG